MVQHLEGKRVRQAMYELMRDHFLDQGRFAARCEEFYGKGEGKDRIPPGFIQAGVVTKQFIWRLLAQQNGDALPQINEHVAVFDALVASNCFFKMPFLPRDAVVDLTVRFDIIRGFEEAGLLENIIMGPSFIFSKYRPAVCAIVVRTMTGDEAIGSGAVVNWKGRSVLLTNRHVVEPRDVRIEAVLAGGEQNLPHEGLEFRLSGVDDLAAAEVPPRSMAQFVLGGDPELLQEVFLMGYPSIPRSNHPVLTVHRGEVNASFHTRDQEELYLISNYASPGSSGGPLIDKKGALIGVVAERLEGRYGECEEAVGIFQHSAAVSLARVRGFLEEHYG